MRRPRRSSRPATSRAKPGQEHLVKEVADLVFHAMVLLGYRDLEWHQVEDELARRFGISGIEEKASRGRPRESTRAVGSGQ